MKYNWIVLQKCTAPNKNKNQFWPLFFFFLYVKIPRSRVSRKISDSFFVFFSKCHYSHLCPLPAVWFFFCAGPVQAGFEHILRHATGWLEKQERKRAKRNRAQNNKYILLLVLRFSNFFRGTQMKTNKESASHLACLLGEDQLWMISRQDNQKQEDNGMV